MNYNARKIAVEILHSVEELKAFSNIEINKRVKVVKDIRDENLIRELVYGVLENKLYIDNIIKNLSRTKYNKIDIIILQILRIGVYQIYFMEHVPDRAACNESVDLTKSFNKKRLSGYVNGILRNASRNKSKEYLPNKKNNLIEYLSIKYSHPKWIVEVFIKDFGESFTEELLKSNNTNPPLSVRVNRNIVTRDELIQILNSHDILAEKTNYSKDGLIVSKPRNITELKEFKEGYFTIQDESSMLVAQVMDPKEGSIVLDICSGPGGKATHIAEAMNNRGKIISRDIFDHKLDLINKNALRLNIDIINTEEYDALIFDDSLKKSVDYCLVDAPCSGLGLLRRKPDIRWNKSIGDLDTLSKMQITILRNAAEYVKTNGILIYSTCTLTKKENMNVINEFLKLNDEYSLVEINTVDMDDNESLKKGYIELYPNIHGTDGFFIAKLKRIK
ncbi:16S rRNA (cytosine(967)-C(5))-methyltransferase RsmB [Clostridium sp. D2Q-11]|uniref:16S rRNA (cytosine(967)-C(5))-methyltransferase n=1 Tax=Anaeromonas frigoriresistens TaxID=2683708 RepID=A0A942Z9W3_9FIRM|nr:16S rRNA (cytosine(967)-C(5))-methyltransferase RsmB [Anaeromonas frigoriresistens]MBS4539738.1 16S rRNA (cytosine(967)-C(5))-methyltransferase RsmB [Anaeromonas frigoriresistens]